MTTDLYVDTSAFLRRVFKEQGVADVNAAAADYLDRGAAVTSSRLLWLEARRVSVRERLRGNDVSATVAADLATVTKLPVTEQVWTLAESIGQHIKSLDAIHLATCELVGADLITFDATMRSVAQARGIHLAL